jgi:hypothetical protein
MMNKYMPGESDEIPELLTESEFREIRMRFSMVAESIGETAEQVNIDINTLFVYYTREVILPENFPDFSEIIVYMLRDDLTGEERAAIGFDGFSVSQPQFASLFVINGASEYSDADRISPYARGAVEKLHSLGILTGMPNARFNPAGLVTWGQTAKIISNIVCAIIVQ